MLIMSYAEKGIWQSGELKKHQKADSGLNNGLGPERLQDNYLYLKRPQPAATGVSV